jgi:hypothetical protein
VGPVKSGQGFKFIGVGGRGKGWKKMPGPSLSPLRDWGRHAVCVMHWRVAPEVRGLELRDFLVIFSYTLPISWQVCSCHAKRFFSTRPSRSGLPINLEPSSGMQHKNHQSSSSLQIRGATIMCKIAKRVEVRGKTKHTTGTK